MFMVEMIFVLYFFSAKLELNSNFAEKLDVFDRNDGQHFTCFYKFFRQT